MFRKIPSRKCLILCSLFVFTIASAKPESTEGFTPIFNGQNLDGWSPKIRNGDEALARKVFSVRDGMIHIFNEDFPDHFELNTGKNLTHGLIYTKQKYSRFILRFEYKWGKRIANNFDEWQYDAGCYYHVTDDKIWPRGIEYQIRFDHTKNRNHTGDFWVAGESLCWPADKEQKFFISPMQGGIMLTEKRNELHGCPKAHFNALNNEWNHCEIIVMGNQYAIHKLNGKIVNMGTNLSVAEGIIGFQSETAEIFYKNILVKELSEDVSIMDFLR